MVFLNRPYHFKCFNSCLPQILLGPFLNTLPHVVIIHFMSLVHLPKSIYFHPNLCIIVRAPLIQFIMTSPNVLLQLKILAVPSIATLPPVLSGTWKYVTNRR